MMNLKGFAARHRMLLSASGTGSGAAIKTLPVGTTVYIKENGTAQGFIIVAHNYPSAGNTLLMRNAATGQMSMGDASVSLSIKSYAGSNVDSWLQNTYLTRFSSYVRNMIPTVTIDSHEITGTPQTLQSTTIDRKAFILSATEITGQATNAEGQKIAYFTSQAMLPTTNVWTRQVSQTDWDDEYHTNLYFFRMYGENYSGAESAVNTSNPNFNVIPCFCLPSGATVDANNHLIVKHTIFGFYIDSSVSDPANAVTYIEDAVGMTPAHMDFANDTFDYGDWQNAFFLPRPCMLKYDGTVDYYLDPNDYAKRADGVTPSDVANVSYGGNAMMEWGQNGKRIWYKIVPDPQPTSASVYITDYQADSDYHAWSFINNQGVLVNHFYTPIYNGSIDGNGRLRSLSGIESTSLCNNKTGAQEIAAAELNNPGTDKLWFTEVYSDVTLINLLLVLMGKSLDTQAVFGNGQGYMSGSNLSKLIAPGTLNTKGMFWGKQYNGYGVKVFGMEHWWGNQWRRFAGLVIFNGTYKYKMTYGTQDGSMQDGYVSSTTGNDYANYINGPTLQATIAGALSKQTYDCNVGLPTETSSTYVNYSDSVNVNVTSSFVCDAIRGGGINMGGFGHGAFCQSFGNNMTSVWHKGAALSCKPLA